MPIATGAKGKKESNIIFKTKGETTMVNKIEVRVVSASPLPHALHGFRLSDGTVEETTAHPAVKSSARRAAE